MDADTLRIGYDAARLGSEGWMSLLVYDRSNGFGRLLWTVLSLALAMVAAPTIAHQRPTGPMIGQTSDGPADTQGNSDIVVIGRRDTRDERRRSSVNYVDALSTQQLSGQVARWREPICVHVTGLASSSAGYVAGEVERIVRRVGTRVADKPCRTNALIQFTPDAGQLLSALARKSTRLLAATALAERARLRQPDLPIRWWSNAVLRGRDGDALMPDAPSAIASVPGINLRTEQDTVWGSSYTSSLISTKVSAETISVVLLVDVPQVTGRKLSAIAAYSAFVTLARVSVNNEAPRDSILGLFRSDYAGDGYLSVQDMRYLSALNDVPRDRNGADQKKTLITTMTNID